MGLLVHFACFCFTYQVITMIQIVLTLTKFVLYVCWLKSCHLVFFLESTNWCKKEKKREKSRECFTYGSHKIIRVFNQLVFKMSWATKLKFSMLTVHCMGSFLLVRAVDQQQKQLAVRFYSRWYIMRSGVGILARLASKKGGVTINYIA